MLSMNLMYERVSQCLSVTCEVLIICIGYIRGVVKWIIVLELWLRNEKDTVGMTLVKKQKRGTVKFLNFNYLFVKLKVDKLHNCISFCRSYNLLPKSYLW